MSATMIWQPTIEGIERARITRFLRQNGLPDLEALQAKALADPAWFWGAVVRDLEIAWFEPPTQILDLSEGVPWAKWFRGARMNLAYECIDKWVERGLGESPAVLWEGEEGATRTWSYRELQAETNRVANALQALGVGPGDRVGIFLPMLPETVATVMAVARIGAIFTPIFSGFAPAAAAARLHDAGVKLLVTADGYYRRGKAVDMKAVADEAVAGAPSVQAVLVVRRTGIPVSWTPGRDFWYDQIVPVQPATAVTAKLDPETPLMIIYTSGTTGRPKGALHVQGGFPIKGAQDMAHLFDVGPGDRMHWFTDLGWMMGPWLIWGTLLNGAAMCLYDGAPDFPGPDRLWALVARHRLTHLGLSPTVIRALAPHGVEQPARHDLSSLRILGGTGEPWNPEPYLWFFEHVGGKRCPIINYSGGTEISGGIFGCVPTRPLKVCSFNVAVPGMGVQILDEEARPVGPGVVGELCLTAPWPGMTRGFWGDAQRYEEAYWSRFPGVWVHGDFASVDEEGFWYIHGRSDDTIKVAGKRTGPAEFESALVAHPAVVEAAAIGVPHPVKGEAVVCFAILAPGAAADEALERALKEAVATALGKPLTPERVHFVQALPKTRNAKIMRRVIKAAYLGKALGDLSALENPGAVDAISAISRH
jgi:acetyl-CoA synthetase